MGCCGSKDNLINVKAAQEKLFHTTNKILSSSRSSEPFLSSSESSESSVSSDMGSSASTSSEKRTKFSPPDKDVGVSTSSSEYPPKGNLEEEYLQEARINADIIDSIPTNDLGESLDARKMKNIWAKPNNSFASTSNGHFSSYSSRHDVINCASASSSAKSVESGDSGVYELEDIITENSPPEIVQRIEEEFTPVENLDLTITGKACPRLLSGSQRVRQQEQEIMDSLREEGFISTSRQKATGGLAFEVVEDTPATESAKGKIKPSNFLPKKHKEHLEKNINKFHLKDLTPEDVARRQFLAEERRKLEMEAKLEKLSNLASKSTMETKLEEIKKKKDQKEDAALLKREAHLKELRDKLKAQNQKAKQIKLKKVINGPPVPVPYTPGIRTSYADDDFFRN